MRPYQSSLIISAGIVVAASIAVTSAWTGATSTPPGGNVDPPINVGSTNQTKAGGLGVDTFLAADNASFLGTVDIGSVAYPSTLTITGNQTITGLFGIGTTSPSQPLSVVGQIFTGGPSGGIKFPDGTVQTTAGGGAGSSAAITAIESCNSGDSAACVTAYDNSYNRSCKQIKNTYLNGGRYAQSGTYRVTYAGSGSPVSVTCNMDDPLTNYPLYSKITSGAATYSIPVTGTYFVELCGASGHGTYGGYGGYVSGDIEFSAGTTLNIYVGSAGASNAGGTNGSGSGSGGTGGGGGGASSEIRIGGTAAANRVAVAGGGGGTGNSSCPTRGGSGGGVDGVACTAGYMPYGGTLYSGNSNGNGTGDGWGNGGGGGGYYGGGTIDYWGTSVYSSGGGGSSWMNALGYPAYNAGLSYSFRNVQYVSGACSGTGYVKVTLR